MGYSVRSGNLWLGYGKLHECSSQATYYAHPSAAETSAQKYMHRTGLKAMTLVGKAGIESMITVNERQTGITLRVIVRLDGKYRVSGKGYVVVSNGLDKACYRVIDQWIGGMK